MRAYLLLVALLSGGVGALIYFLSPEYQRSESAFVVIGVSVVYFIVFLLSFRSDKRLPEVPFVMVLVTGLSFIALNKVEQGNDVVFSTIAVFAVILSGMMFYGIPEEKTRSADDWLKRKPIIIRTMPTGVEGEEIHFIRPLAIERKKFKLPKINIPTGVVSAIIIAIALVAGVYIAGKFYYESNRYEVKEHLIYDKYTGKVRPVEIDKSWKD